MSNPEVTLTVFTYNQEKYVKESVESALAQDYSPLTIVISDDCSTDRTFEIIQDTVKNYKGPHKVILNRNEKNMGIVNHFNYVVKNFVKTDIFIVQAGDDISKSNRVSTIVEHFKNFPNCYALCSNAHLIDESGNIIRNKFMNAKENVIQSCEIICKHKRLFCIGATSAYRKAIFSHFGPIPDSVRNEDFLSHLRASIIGFSMFINIPLVLYRKHSDNLSLIFRMQKTITYEEFKEQYLRFLKNLKANIDIAMSETEKNKISVKCNRCLQKFADYVNYSIELFQSDKRNITKFLHSFKYIRYLGLKNYIKHLFPKLWFYMYKWRWKH